MALLEYQNQNAIRNLPITPTLKEAIELAVLDVYGPGYKAVVYSGGQHSHGKRRTGSVRHNEGKAGDFHIFGPDGEKVTGDSLAPLVQYWSAKGHGGIGAEMRGGGIHLDEHKTPPSKKGGMFWDYRNQGGSLTPKQREAYLKGKKGELPQLVERVGPDRIPNREQGLDDQTLHTAALTLLGEAAGEGRDGMLAVANVMNNRKSSKRYPNDIQSVAFQPAQFSTWNEGKGGNNPDERYSRKDPIYQEARAAAADVLSGRVKDPTYGATSYYAPKAMPGGKAPYWWNSEAKNGTKAIGNHRFAIGNKPASHNLQKVQEPTTALAAIEQIAPPPLPRPVPANAYAPQSAPAPKPRPASILDKISALNNAKQFERGKPNKFSDMGYGVQKVADAYGNAALNTGKSVIDGILKMASLPDPVKLPRPRPQKDSRFDFSGLDNLASPELQMALDMKVAGLNNPITPPNPVSLPRPRPQGVRPIQPVGLKAPVPPMPPGGLQDQQLNPLQRTRRSVRQALAPILNFRHDMRGQVDGLRIGARQALQRGVDQFVRPSHMRSIDSVASNGGIFHTNGYVYKPNANGGFTNVGKVSGNGVKTWNDTNEKPKGYRYYDNATGEWKEK